MPADAEIAAHPSLLAWALSAVTTAFTIVLGLLYNGHARDIEKLKKVAHSPEACPGAASFVDRSELQHMLDTFMREAKENRTELLSEIKGLRAEVIAGFQARPTRDELRG